MGDPHPFPQLEKEIELFEAAFQEGPDSTVFLSECWLSARELEEEATETLEEPVRELKAQVKAYDKKVDPLKKRLKALLKGTKERLDTVYGYEEKALAEQAQAFLEADDHESFSALPDAPPLAEGCTFAELKRANVYSLELLPSRFLVPDLKAVEAALKKGEDVPGAVLVTQRSWRRAGAKGGAQ